MLAVHLVAVRLLTVAWTAPEVSQEEGSYASRFYHWFSESSKHHLKIVEQKLMTYLLTMHILLILQYLRII